MTEISLAWLFTKVTAPAVGAMRTSHIEGAAKAVRLTLTVDELTFLEEPYVLHNLVGVMAENTPVTAKDKYAGTGTKKLKGGIEMELHKTDPEFAERFEHFAFDEVVNERLRPDFNFSLHT